MRVIAIAKALVFGAVGGALFNQAGIPLAWMLGSLFMTAIGGRFLGPAHVPRWARECTVPVLGVLLGSSFTPAIFQRLAEWPAGLLAVALYVAGAAALGYVYFRRIARLDPVTAFFAALPGGLSDLTLIGAALGANLGRLALIHAMRVVVVVTIIPLAIGLIGGPMQTGASSLGTLRPDIDLAHAVALVACAVSGVFLGRVLRLPAAPVIGPLIVSAAVHLTGLAAIVPPSWLVVIAQVVLGSYIGARLSEMTGPTIRTSIVHGIVWGVAVVLLGFLVAFASAPVADIPFASMLLGVAPGGLPEMAVLTLVLGVDVAFVTTCHLIRLIVVYMITPVAVSVGGWSVSASGADD